MLDKSQTENLLKGIGVIIDDDLTAVNSQASRLTRSIREAGIPMVEYPSIPDIRVIENLGNVSFVILDWRFGHPDFTNPDVNFGDAYMEESNQTILSFMKELMTHCFAPVFVITGQSFDDVKYQLAEENLFSEEPPSRILLCQKPELNDFNDLVEKVTAWMENTPSALVLKLWEKQAVKAKNEMFLDLYYASASWVHVILKALLKDSDNHKAVNHDFKEILNNIFTNRMTDESFSEIYSERFQSPDSEEIRKVLQGERYIPYGHEMLPDRSYTGDLYKKPDGTYYLNIRAQCNLARDDDPILYLLQGTPVEKTKVCRPLIKFKKSAKMNWLYINAKKYNIAELSAAEGTRIVEINNELQRFDKNVSFSTGEILEKNEEAYIACVAEQYLIRFDFKSFRAVQKSIFEQEHNAERIGRLIPPYITRIQQRYSFYMVREGQMGIPPELFDLQ